MNYSGYLLGLMKCEKNHTNMERMVEQVPEGNKSVGVSRQYAGVSGKVDNCQVGVYCSLCNEENAALIDTSLFLPQKWIDDKTRYRIYASGFAG